MPLPIQQYLPLSEPLLRKTLAAWQVANPGTAILALLAEADRAQLPLLQLICRELHLPLIGGVFPALITVDGFQKCGVCLISLPKAPPYFMLGEKNIGHAGESIAKAVRKLLIRNDCTDVKRPTLFMLFDGLIPDISSRLDDLYLRLEDRVQYVGVNTGSETFQPIVSIFTEDCVSSLGMLGFLSDEIERTIITHGYPMPDQVMMATSTTGNRISQIDWQPAFETYRELVQKQYSVILNKDNFYQYAVHFPIGLLRASEQVLVRIPVALEDDGSLICVGEIPENALLTLLQAPPPDPGGCITTLATQLADKNSASSHCPVVFYCAGRRMHMGDSADQELSTLYRISGEKSMLGAVSLGEIGATEQAGYPFFHNAALVACEWQQ